MMTTTTMDIDDSGLFGWWRAGTPEGKRAFIAASMAWALDAFDVMLFSLTLPDVIRDLSLTKTQAGALGSITLLGGAAGGLIFGWVADRFGRTKAMMGAVLIYSIFTGACGLSHTLVQFAVLRALLGLGMGGVWAAGASLVAETWPTRIRGRVLGFMQSAWAIGFAAAAIVNAFVNPLFGWRAVFFVGVLPALFVFWVQRRVKEPEMWREQARAPVRKERFSDMFRGSRLRITVLVTFMNACALFGWWGLNGWIPAYLKLPRAEGGVGLGTATMSWFVVAMQVGMWLGYVSFGYISDAIGRKRVYVVYLLAASVLLPLYGFLKLPIALLLLGPFVAFFGTGYFSGFGAVTAELYPTSIRASAQGFAYNIGRIASAAAPFAVGSLATSNGFGVAFLVSGAAFLVGAIAWVGIPETRGRELT
ncbi:MAG TPA: MFS transporter [Gemmatimonadaceae bacterium]|jgi:MFS family permease